MKIVYLSLVTYKNHDVTRRCLESLEKVKTDGIICRIVVVNNDSMKKFSYTWKGKSDFRILNQSENLGFSGGHNITLQLAKDTGADYTLVLNNDTKHKPDFLIRLVETARKKTDGVLFGPKIYFAKGHEFHKDRYEENEKGKVFWYAGGKIDWENLLLSHRGVDDVDTGQFDEVSETDFVSGCCMLIAMRKMKNVLFDDRYFLYLEDSDLNERVKREGYSVWYVPDSVIWHENAGSTGGSGSQLQDYFISRNRLLFGYTYAPLRTKFALFRESLRILRSGRVWQQRGIRDYYLHRFGKGSYPV